MSHDFAERYVRRILEQIPPRSLGLEIGSLDIGAFNGGESTAMTYDFPVHRIDLVPGPNVDEVGDASEMEINERFDVVIIMEVFEHTPFWRQIIENSHRALKSGGYLIATMATDPRRPHSAYDPIEPPDDEWYENIRPQDLAYALDIYEAFSLDRYRGDLRCWARKD